MSMMKRDVCMYQPTHPETVALLQNIVAEYIRLFIAQKG